MGSEKQAQNMLTLIDRSLNELDVLDKRLGRYDELLIVSLPVIITVELCWRIHN